eukprot:Gregarina_sp_Pseudo_9__1675@NODE_212_length_3602_cov_23_476284_g197_i0_p2_GENE_NODE_212_length_3602_cov_23_476284_g197_i0NODE_212_length_3602_cov_23_476284_g197_i0_p2_ORF_typecomplete_len391_score108_28PRP4/PF08799_11/0_14_NODE_212_length_3602_cov_23_476284_g197_i020843256
MVFVHIASAHASLTPAHSTCGFTTASTSSRRNACVTRTLEPSTHSRLVSERNRTPGAAACSSCRVRGGVASPVSTRSHVTQRSRSVSTAPKLNGPRLVLAPSRVRDGDASGDALDGRVSVAGGLDMPENASWLDSIDTVGFSNGDCGGCTSIEHFFITVAGDGDSAGGNMRGGTTPHGPSAVSTEGDGDSGDGDGVSIKRHRVILSCGTAPSREAPLPIDSPSDPRSPPPVGDETPSPRGGDETPSARGGDETPSARGGDETASARGGDETASPITLFGETPSPVTGSVFSSPPVVKLNDTVLMALNTLETARLLRPLFSFGRSSLPSGETPDDFFSDTPSALLSAVSVSDLTTAIGATMGFFSSGTFSSGTTSASSPSSTVGAAISKIS